MIFIAPEVSDGRVGFFSRLTQVPNPLLCRIETSSPGLPFWVVGILKGSRGALGSSEKASLTSQGVRYVYFSS